MKDQTYDLTLTGPAKVGGIHKASGSTVTVDHAVALQLAASGVLDPVVAADLSRALSRSAAAAWTREDFDRAVAEKAQELAEAVAGVAIETAIADRIGEIERVADERIETAEGEHRAELETLDAELDAAKARIVELEAKVSDLEAGLVAEADRANAAEKALAAAKPAKSTK